MTDSIKPKLTFQDLITDKDILRVITELDFKEPTAIQIKAIPLIIEGKNIIAQSATGTGKTIAFLAGILPNITKQKKVQALIIVPTRELANQVYEEVKKMAKYKNTEACVVFGGTSINNQARQLRYADMVIGTPGRIIDQIDRGNLRLEAIKYLILDEADRMCDMGFFEDITKIIKQTPKDRQTMLFSATISDDISTIEKQYIHNAQRIVIENTIDPKNLLQEYYLVKSNMKFSLLLYLVKQHCKKAIVFCNTRSEVDVLFNNLKENRIECFKLHGGLEQNKRTGTIERYHQNKEGVLISTDVSARGIHIDNLEYIYNYDLPKDPTQYIHRIGRTARAGKKGKAIAIITSKEETDFLKMCRRFGYKVENKQLPPLVPMKLNRSTEETSRLNDRNQEGRNVNRNRFAERKEHFSKNGRDRKKENVKKVINGEKTPEEMQKQRRDFFKHKDKLQQKKYTKRR
ncbi:MAG: DEAD/DEAH box helicase [archaeon]|jgi:ATP-dependent RNA helicase DeaD